jgi:hypothetical protein
MRLEAIIANSHSKRAETVGDDTVLVRYLNKFVRYEKFQPRTALQV